jgi:hypothetical protein
VAILKHRKSEVLAITRNDSVIVLCARDVQAVNRRLAVASGVFKLQVA